MNTIMRRLAAGLFALTAIVSPSIVSPSIAAPSAEAAGTSPSITSPSIVAPSAEVAVRQHHQPVHRGAERRGGRQLEQHRVTEHHQPDHRRSLRRLAQLAPVVALPGGAPCERRPTLKWGAIRKTLFSAAILGIIPDLVGFVFG